MKSEEFNNIASGCQSIILSLAVLVGGLWALYTFWGTRQLQKAQSELLGLQITSDRAKVELLQIERRQVAVLNLTIHIASPLETLPNKQVRLIADVEIRNDGLESMMVDLGKSRLLAVPAGAIGDQRASLEVAPLGKIGNPNSPAGVRHFRPNQVRHLLFVTPIASTSAYFLQTEISFRQTTIENGKVVPTGDTYMAIEQAVVPPQGKLRGPESPPRSSLVRRR